MKSTKSISSVLCLSLVLSLSSISYANEVGRTATENTLIGKDRYQTAIEVSKEGWSSANEAVIVNSESIVDALSVTPFAKLKNAPILLTEKNNLNLQTKKELERLGVKKVYIIGLSGSVSDNVEKQLESNNLTVDRIGGSDRHQTALNIAKKIEGLKDISEIAVINGYTGLADAVSIASVAATNGMVILPVSDASGVSSFKDFIASKNISKSYIIGSTNAVSDKIKQSLPNSERIGGADRNETNGKVIEKFYTSNDLDNVFVAKDGMKKQNQLIDALAVGVLASKENSPVLIVGDKLSATQKSIFTNKKATAITQVGSGGNENAFAELKDLQESSTGKKVMYVANTDKVNVRSDATIEASVVGYLNNGDEVEVLEVLKTGWVKIKYNDDIGYVSGSYLTSNKPNNSSENVKIKYVKEKDGLNVRKGPSTEDEKIGQLPYGSKVETVEMFATGWVKIKYNSGYGYVSNDYLSDTPVI
ncbi:cell wall-binding repeat-containing protein [Clostridioides sp. ES-S-0048-02]|uniref:cell wall-binding repeat-containing protein n=1 Tax=Clostridioides sp. ES-S-0048-02 TaxID=2770777 RepID=UPI001D10D88A|nr:cell wall-binding repeat-containing protein [Clostridioides sp. ES-S-0048-02]